MPTGPMPLAAAQAIVDEFLARQTPPAAPSDFVALAAALGRVLAAPICADHDLPPFARSTRDGYACRAAEANTHQSLRLAGATRAGQTSTHALQPGEIWEIMTGAPVPDEADCVLMQEHVEVEGSSVRQIPSRTLAGGDNIVPRGAEARAGQTLAPIGLRITPAAIALAAQCGLAQLPVFPQPRVAILSSGDELVPHHQPPGPGQIRNSNSPMLAALVAAAGGLPVPLDSAADRPESLDHALALALHPQAATRLLLITGGISVGRYDLVADALARHHATLLFRGVAIQPGKPVTFALLPRSGQLPPLPVFALPGNPVSTAVTFQLFAQPVLEALGGQSHAQPRFARAAFDGHWSGKPGLTRFLPAHCNFAPQPTVRLTPWQGSGDIAAFAASNCFVMIPDTTAALAAGETVSILLR